MRSLGIATRDSKVTVRSEPVQIGVRNAREQPFLFEGLDDAVRGRRREPQAIADDLQRKRRFGQREQFEDVDGASDGLRPASETRLRYDACFRSLRCRQRICGSP